MNKLLKFILLTTISISSQICFADKTPEVIRNENSNDSYRFTENKNQWNEVFKFKSAIEGGSFYLRTNGFSFDFYDTKKVSQLLGRHGNFVDNDNKQQARIDFLAADRDIINCHWYNVNFLNSNPSVVVKTPEASTDYTNYFLGNDPKKWASHVKSYNFVTYNNLYKDIDLKVYYKDGNHKYDFIVKPKANPTSIQLDYQGVSNMYLGYGNLYIETSINKIIEQKPYAYQLIRGQKQTVQCNYVLKNNILTFEFPRGYDTNHELIIDPTLVFSTYSGSITDNFGYTATFDSDGFLYAGGTAFGTNTAAGSSQYVTTPGAYQTVWGGGSTAYNEINIAFFGTDIAITKYDTTGTKRIYSTYLGGAGDEMPHSLVVNSNHELYIYGTTGSANFPVSNNAISKVFKGGTLARFWGTGVSFKNGTDMIISRLNSDGSQLLSSTYLGGTGNDGVNYNTKNRNLKYNYADESRGEIELDKNEDVYIVSTTSSTDLPIVGNTFQKSYGGGEQDGCVFKLKNDLSAIIWSTYLGGNKEDAIYSIALDKNENLYVAGGTTSTDLITSNTNSSHNYLAANFQGGRADGFITHIDKDGWVINSKYFGTPDYDQVYFVETDAVDNVYLYGQTEAPSNTLIFNAKYNNPNSGLFISKLKPKLDSVIWSTVIGTGAGAPNLSPTAFLVDVCNKIYLSGWGGGTNEPVILPKSLGGDTVVYNKAVSTTDMEVTPDAFQKTTDGSDFYLFVMESDASAINYGSFFGGATSHEHVDGGTSRFDKTGKMYQSVCAGCGGNNDFPIKPNPGAVSTTNNSPNCNNGVFKFNFDLPLIIADFSTTKAGYCLGDSSVFIDKSHNGESYKWDFGDNATSLIKSPKHLFQKENTFNVTLKVSNSKSCNITDSITKEVTVITPVITSLKDTSLCLGDSIQIGGQPLKGHIYQWDNSSTLSNNSISNPIAFNNLPTTYTLITKGVCADTLSQKVDVIDINLKTSKDTSICGNLGSVNFSANSSGTADEFIWSSNQNFSDMLNSNRKDSTLHYPLTQTKVFYIKASKKQCEKVGSVFANVSNIVVLTKSNDTLCVNDTINLEATNLNLTDVVTYSWLPTSSIISNPKLNSVKISPLTSTLFFLHSENQDNCKQIDSIPIFVSQLSKEHIDIIAQKDTIALGYNTLLQASPSSYNYLWTPFSSLDFTNKQNVIASPKEHTTYHLKISDKGFCEQIDSIRIYVFNIKCSEPNIFIANAFTPNNDGNNDYVFVRGNFINTFKLEIFNRWGEKIFETSDKTTGWDGTYNGKKLEAGVYHYYLTASCIDGQDFFKKGNITLIR